MRTISTIQASMHICLLIMLTHTISRALKLPLYLSPKCHSPFLNSMSMELPLLLSFQDLLVATLHAPCPLDPMGSTQALAFDPSFAPPVSLSTHFARSVSTRRARPSSLMSRLALAMAPPVDRFSSSISMWTMARIAVRGYWAELE